jgi:hypothetical protein
MLCLIQSRTLRSHSTNGFWVQLARAFVLLALAHLSLPSTPGRRTAATFTANGQTRSLNASYRVSLSRERSTWSPPPSSEWARPPPCISASRPTARISAEGFPERCRKAPCVGAALDAEVTGSFRWICPASLDLQRIKEDFIGVSRTDCRMYTSSFFSPFANSSFSNPLVTKKKVQVKAYPGRSRIKVTGSIVQAPERHLLTYVNQEFFIGDHHRQRGHHLPKRSLRKLRL